MKQYTVKEMLAA